MTSDVLYTLKNFQEGRLRITSKLLNVPLHISAYKVLHDLIENGELVNELPSENELTRLLGVGRSTVRMALLLLHEDGYTKSIQGKGTFIKQERRTSKWGLNNKFTADDIISSLGMEYAVSEGSYSFSKDDLFLQDKLSPAQGEEIGVLLAVHTADGKPAIISQDYFLAKGPLSDEQLKYGEAEKVFKNMYLKKAHRAMFTFSPTVAEGFRKTKLNLGRPDLLLLAAHEIYDDENNLIVFSKYYFNTEIIQYTFEQMCS